MIAPTPFFAHRGTHIRIFEEARALEARGHQITIVTYHNGDDIHDYVDTNIDVRRIRRWLFWYKKTEAGANWQKILLNIFLIRKTFSLTRSWKPDVIHGHLHEGVLIGALMRFIFFWRSTPLVSDFHGVLVGEMRSHGYLSHPFLVKIFKRIEYMINGLGDAAIVSSSENVRAIKESREDRRAYHIYDGVNAVAYDQHQKNKEELRKKYGVPVDAMIVGYTGALIKNKGISILLDAIMSLKDASENIHFVIGGFPDQWVRDFVRKEGLEDLVTVIAPLNYFSLPEVNTIADVTVDPKTDGVGQASGKILQYAAAHTAVICTDRSVNKKYLADAGVYLSEMTSENLAKTIKDLYNNPSKVDEHARSARACISVFHWKKVGEKIEGVYKSCMKNQKYL